MNRGLILERLRSSLPGLMAVYAFGSRVSGDAGPESDLDLAVLLAGYADPVRLWELGGELEDQVGSAVDLLDLRAATTVMQYAVVTTGERLWAGDALAAALFEAAVLSERTALEEARAGLMADIRESGRIHGR